MPGRSGIELAETLQNLKTPPVVVFVTAFAEYAADAYNLDAVDYIVKPVEDARLSKALDKIETALGVRRAVHTPRQPLRLTVDRGGKRCSFPWRMSATLRHAPILQRRLRRGNIPDQ